MNNEVIMQYPNPNMIIEVHDPLPRLAQMNIRPPVHEIEKKYNPHNQKLIDNAVMALSTYQKAKELLIQAQAEILVPYLCMTLVPQFSDETPSLSDQKIGGTPDIRDWLYVKPADGYKNLKKVWPRCGVCHERMKFVGQFDVLPWVIPLVASFGKTTAGSMSPFGGWNESGFRDMIPRLAEHHSIYETMMLATFACPFSGMHFDNPNYDSRILVTGKRSSVLEEENKLSEAEKLADEAAYLAAFPKIKRENSFTLNSKKIVGWDFRLTIDGNLWSFDELDDMAISDMMEENPKVFAVYGNNMLGEPRSQQEPKRFFTQRGYYGPERMTPFFNFNDDDADFTYQIYADFSSDGFGYHCKVDGSCT